MACTIRAVSRARAYGDDSTTFGCSPGGIAANHRPSAADCCSPSGESWCDVILRLRSLVDTMARDYHGERVLVVCHQVIVLCMRYLLERMTEEEILAIDRQGDVANCGVTFYEYDPTVGQDGSLVLRAYNFVAPLEEEGAPVTSEPDAPVGVK